MKNTSSGQPQKKNILIVLLTLISSSASLMCCALPAIFVILGFGSAFASLMHLAPWLSVLSEYKWWIFSIAFIFIILSIRQLYIARRFLCPISESQRKACVRLKTLTWIILIISIVMLILSLFFTTIAKYIL